MAVLSLGNFTAHKSHADNNHTVIFFDVLENPENKNYAAALKLMQEDVYLKKAPEYWDYDANTWRRYPLIAIGEADLNGDGVNEVIVNPVEKIPYEEGRICPPEIGCPIFVFNTNKQNKIKVLGAFNAFGVALDNSSYQGYRRLRAYTLNPETSDPSFYELYQYQRGLYQKLSVR